MKRAKTARINLIVIQEVW